MNCRNVKRVIGGLEPDRNWDRAMVEEALFHLKICSKCAERVQQERMLLEGLRTLARSTEQVEAPARIEAFLLAEFRRHNRASREPGLAAASGSSSGLRLWTLRAATLAAVSLALCLGVTNQWWRTRRFTRSARVESRAVSSSPPLNQGQLPSGISVRGASVAAVKTSRKSAAQEVRPPRELARVHGDRSSSFGSRPDDGGPAIDAMGQAASNRRPRTTADFILVAPCDVATCLNNGEIVRVSLPRSVLPTLGFTAGESAETVHAELLVSEDGITRAIRFP
jgi:hypothetical protein